jgi:hypothetical protein
MLTVHLGQELSVEIRVHRFCTTFRTVSGVLDSSEGVSGKARPWWLIDTIPLSTIEPSAPIVAADFVYAYAARP